MPSEMQERKDLYRATFLQVGSTMGDELSRLRRREGNRIAPFLLVARETINCTVDKMMKLRASN